VDGILSGISQSLIEGLSVASACAGDGSPASGAAADCAGGGAEGLAGLDAVVEQV
jgi:hypothetical protein